MYLEILKLKKQINLEIENAKNVKTLENIRIKFLGKKGIFSKQINIIKILPIDERKKIGYFLNKYKTKILELILKKKKKFKKIKIKNKLKFEQIDVSLPGKRLKQGNLHPISYIIKKIKFFFYKLGFLIIEGLEIEDKYHNFDALNIPINHPSRMQNDTFWIDSNKLLRTQTSSIQIRTLNKYNIPIKIISPGKVYRKDNDSTHSPMFHQLEGLIIDKEINFCKMKGLIYKFLYDFFDKDIKIRFRPSYFPFTEPSAEIDIFYKNSWLEILGCGIVHSKILKNASINTESFIGCAFGFGIERLAMIKYGIKDIRLFFENDLRFLKQFK